MTLGYVVVPFADRWRAREEVIVSERERLARLRGLTASEARLRAAVLEREAGLETGRRRLLSARTPGLAASALQSRLQDFADMSQVTVSGLDVTGTPDTIAGPLPMIPATVSAIGDIYGITDLLYLIEHGPLQLEIVELNVAPNPALRGNLLQMTATLRGAYVRG